MADLKHLLLWISVLLLGSGCQRSTPPVLPEDVPLAKVYNKTLLYSEIKNLIPSDTSPQDSALQVNALVERWVRDMLLMNEAEKNIPKDLNIDQLVREYRSSLVLYQYEKLLIEQNLDSTITEEELLKNYEETKDQYPLQENIVRCYFIQIPIGAEELNKVDKWWRKISDREALYNVMDYAQFEAQKYLLDDSTWYSTTFIDGLFLPQSLSSGDLRPNRDFENKDEEYIYRLKVLDFRPQGSISPLSFIAPQLKKVILRERKNSLLEEKREELYEEEINRNQVKIFIQ